MPKKRATIGVKNMDNQVEEVKRKIDIVEFLGSFITLKRTGRNFKAICPFHQEKTPSFYVSPDRQFWYCFGACQEGGDVIKFLMKWENITFVEALRELADKVGVKLKRLSFEDRVWKKRERLIGLNTLAAEYFEFIIHKSKYGKKALDYLRSRNLREATIKKFQLGYAPDSWDSLMKFLVKKKYSEDEIFESGLLVKGQRGNLYDRFRGRIVFPIKDHRGNVIGFSGRILEKDVEGAKYINTPETPLYHKRETLYGIDISKDAIRKAGNAILVEGEFDMIVPYEHGIENIVAIKGSAVTQEQLMFLKRYTSRITLALDADAAGQEAVKRGIAQAENLELEVGILKIDFGKDPDEAVRNDVLKFKKLIKSPIPIYDFVIEVAQTKYPEDDPYSKKKIGDEVAPFITVIKNPIIFSYYVKKLSSILGVSESSVESLVRKTMREDRQKSVTVLKKKEVNKEERALMIQKYLLSMIFQNAKPATVAHTIFKTLEPIDFSIPSHEQIIQAFLQFNKKNKNSFDVKTFLKMLPAQLLPVFDELYLFASVEMDFGDNDIEKLVYEVKKFSLKRKIAEFLAVKDELSEKKKDELKELSQRLNQVEKTLLTL